MHFFFLPLGLQIERYNECAEICNMFLLTERLPLFLLVQSLEISVSGCGFVLFYPLHFLKWEMQCRRNYNSEMVIHTDDKTQCGKDTTGKLLSQTLSFTSPIPQATFEKEQKLVAQMDKWIDKFHGCVRWLEGELKWNQTFTCQTTLSIRQTNKRSLVFVQKYYYYWFKVKKFGVLSSFTNRKWQTE